MNQSGQRQYNSLEKTVWNLPGIPVTQECKRIKTSAEYGSERLGRAIRSAIWTYAKQAGISNAQAYTILMGGVPRQLLPGQERIYKTASIERISNVKFDLQAA